MVNIIDLFDSVRQEILQKTFVASEKRFEFMKGKQYSLDDPNVADSVHSLFQEALLARLPASFVLA